MDPDTLLLVEASDGSTCVYTTLSVEGTEEARFIRIISPTVAERAFPKMLEKLGIKVDADNKWDRSKEIFEDGISEREKGRVMARRNILS